MTMQGHTAGPLRETRQRLRPHISLELAAWSEAWLVWQLAVIGRRRSRSMLGTFQEDKVAEDHGVGMYPCHPAWVL